MLKVIIAIGLASFLVSCDPGYAVILSNNSGKDNTVKVITSNRYRLTVKDSLLTTEAADISFSKATYKQTAIDTKDTIAHYYSFTLEAGRNALLQRGIGSPDMSEKIIIGTDTILMQKKDSRVKIKKRMGSTSVMINIQ